MPLFEVEGPVVPMSTLHLGQPWACAYNFTNRVAQKERRGEGISRPKAHPPQAGAAGLKQAVRSQSRGFSLAEARAAAGRGARGGGSGRCGTAGVRSYATSTILIWSAWHPDTFQAAEVFEAAQACRPRYFHRGRRGVHSSPRCPPLPLPPVRHVSFRWIDDVSLGNIIIHI